MPAKKLTLEGAGHEARGETAGTAQEHCLRRQIALSEFDMGTVPCHIPVIYVFPTTAAAGLGTAASSEYNRPVGIAGCNKSQETEAFLDCNLPCSGRMTPGQVARLLTRDLQKVGIAYAKTFWTKPHGPTALSNVISPVVGKGLLITSWS
eukprot:SM000257S08637  [mRNA]  locus=s257:149002:151518:+ [translate_table: standard]